MRHPDIDYMMVMERRRDELAEAENYRLVKAALRANQQGEGPRRQARVRLPVLALARMMSLFGGWLLNWSCRLQTRYQVLGGELVENQASPCA